MTYGLPISTFGTVAIVAALPRELGGLSRLLGAHSVVSRAGVQVATASLMTGPKVVLASAGMGLHRAGLAVAAARAQGPVQTILSVGLAGACDARLKAGTVLSACLIIDSQTGERFVPDAKLNMPETGVLVTVGQIAGIEEKQRLHASYNAAAVDMEAATVARLAQAHGIAFGAVKAISDEHMVDLSRLSRFAGTRGQFNTASFVVQTLASPTTWRGTAELGRSSKIALENLTSVLHHFLGGPTRT